MSISGVQLHPKKPRAGVMLFFYLSILRFRAYFCSAALQACMPGKSPGWTCSRSEHSVPGSAEAPAPALFVDLSAAGAV